jgi:hypothetical protein
MTFTACREFSSLLPFLPHVYIRILCLRQFTGHPLFAAYIGSFRSTAIEPFASTAIGPFLIRIHGIYSVSSRFWRDVVNHTHRALMRLGRLFSLFPTMMFQGPIASVGGPISARNMAHLINQGLVSLSRGGGAFVTVTTRIF